MNKRPVTTNNNENEIKKQKLEHPGFDLRLRHPSNFLFCGPSSSGKTTLALEIIKNKRFLFNVVPKHVILIYSHPQKVYQDMYALGVITHMIDGYENFEQLKEMVMSYKYDGQSILVFDDQLSSLNDDILRIFHELSHHGSCSVMFLSQNLFFANRKFRSISLNAHYIFVLKQVRDSSQIINLAKQYSPYRPNYVIEAYRQATRSSFSYLLFDFRNDSPDIIRLRTKILPREHPPIVFIENS